MNSIAKPQRVAANFDKPRSHLVLELSRPSRLLCFDPSRRNTEGASSVEFALLAGLLFTIIFANIEFGVWGMNQTIVAGAARDAAVQFAQTQSADQGIKKAFASGSGLSTPLLASEVVFRLDGATTPSAANSTCIAGQLIAAKITHPYELLVGSFISGALGISSLNLTAESVAVCE